MLLNCGVGEDSWESLGLQGDPNSQSYRKSVLSIHWKNWCWNWNSNTLAIWFKNWLIGKDPDTGKDWRQEKKGMTEGEMVWFHGHEFEWALGVGDGQGSLVCCSPRGCNEWDMTERLNWTDWRERETKPLMPPATEFPPKHLNRIKLWDSGNTMETKPQISSEVNGPAILAGWYWGGCVRKEMEFS